MTRFVSMPRLRHPLAAAALLLAAQGACAAVSFDYIGQAVLSTSTTFAGTRVGGLSGIDYDAATQTYVAISDDRSQYNPAHYYRMTLDYSQFSRSNTAGTAGVQFTGVTTLRDPQGEPFGLNRVDGESIRLVRGANGPTLLWTNEGQRTGAGFQNPTLREAYLDGTHAREFSVPQTYLPVGTPGGQAAGDSGIRNNLAFESLTLSADGKSAYVATESALAQDGGIATVDAGTQVRIARFDYASGQRNAEYVYQLDAIPTAPVGGGSADNGLVELLAVGEGRLLALERSYAAGVGNNIRLYLTDTAGATDVAGLSSLAGAGFASMQKTLLLDLGTLVNADGSALKLDNVEGLTWGADHNGEKTLLLVSDNNFSGGQFTQFIALGIHGDLAVTPVPEPSTYALMLGGVALLAWQRRRAAVQR
ncbi:esterase-like activity of phytase family protein [Aquincola sp. MAHUQ-54]|uniref:Esterase-like activity of phytase family protein n=1 Tax=Aquincola agrisoli TaxID=3119538 RepID=A0AAW9QD65_9BURK